MIMHQKQRLNYIKVIYFDVPWHIAELILDNGEEGAIYTDADTGELLIYVNE